MAERIPSNIILKTYYPYTFPALQPNYIQEIKSRVIEYIKRVDRQFIPQLEIEAKFGKYDFFGGISGLQMIRETFMIPDEIKSKQNNFRFNPGLPPAHFYKILSAIDAESKLKNSNIKEIGHWNYYEEHYKNGKRKSQIYQDGKFIKEECIIKNKKTHFNVRNFNNDFRITCSIENQTDIIGEDIIELRREKFRTSYQFNFYRIDFTITSSSDKSFNNTSYELEIEINKISEFIFNNEKSKYFFEDLSMIIERLLHNVVNLYSPLGIETAGLIKENDKPFGIYGNYFKSNLRKNKKEEKEKENDIENKTLIQNQNPLTNIQTNHITNNRTDVETKKEIMNQPSEQKDEIEEEDVFSDLKDSDDEI